MVGKITLSPVVGFLFAPGRNGGKRASVHGSSAARRSNNYALQSGHTPAQPGRQDLFDLRERAHRCVIHPLDVFAQEAIT